MKQISSWNRHLYRHFITSQKSAAATFVQSYSYTKFSFVISYPHAHSTVSFAKQAHCSVKFGNS